MRIFMIVPGGVDRGGQERVIPALLWLIERLARSHEVVVIALRQYAQPDRYSLLGAEVVNLGAYASESRLQRLQRSWRMLAETKATFGRPDILHAFWAIDCGPLAALAGWFWQVPMVLSLGGGELAWIPRIRYGGQGTLHDRLRIAWALRRAAVITGGSHFLLDHLASPIGLWLPLGVDTSFFRPPATTALVPPRRLLQVATLNEVKDPFTLLRAFDGVRSSFADVHLDLVGQDLLHGRVQQLIKQLDLEASVTLHGTLRHDALLTLYQQAYLYVQSSLFESQGVAVCEAAACAVPTAGTAVGLVAELSPGAALAVPAAEVKALESAMVRLLDDATCRQEMGAAARTWAEMHNTDWTARQFEQIYQQILDSRGT